MKCLSKFRLGLKPTSFLINFIDVVSAITVTVLCIMSWSSVKHNVMYFYTAPKKPESNELVNEKMTAIVSYWVLTLLLITAYFRIVLVVLLFTAVKKKSIGMSQAWIVLKALLTIMGIFLCLASLTINFYTKVATTFDLVSHLCTIYFIKTLANAMDDFQSIINHRHDDEK